MIDSDLPVNPPVIIKILTMFNYLDKKCFKCDALSWTKTDIAEPSNCQIYINLQTH